VFAGVIRAPITSVLIIVEMTNGYSLILPLMIANMSAYALARALRPTPIYEALLEQDGIHLTAPRAERDAPNTIDTITLAVLPALDRDFVSFYPALPATALLADSSSAGRQELFPVLDPSGGLIGMITLDDLTTLADMPELPGSLVNAADLMHPPIALREHDTVHAAYNRLVTSGLRELPVVDADGRVIGLVNEVAIAHAYLRTRHPPAIPAAEE
jgi:CIC family chloride channel protein